MSQTEIICDKRQNCSIGWMVSIYGVYGKL